jgi:hypothetical protein
MIPWKVKRTSSKACHKYVQKPVISNRAESDQRFPMLDASESLNAVVNEELQQALSTREKRLNRQVPQTVGLIGESREGFLAFVTVVLLSLRPYFC